MVSHRANNSKKYKHEMATTNREKRTGRRKQVCQKCGNDTFKVFIKIIIDDARLFCAKCVETFI